MAGTRRERSYQIEDRQTSTVVVGHGARTELPRRVAELQPDGVFLVHDTAVADAAEEVARLVDARVSIPVAGGERAKDVAVLTQLAARLVAERASRRSLLVALGGGSLCDLVGFLGAIHLRGVATFLCPTTTLAACDAALGGKCGIDFAGLKNVLGVTRQSALVLCDTHWFETLPDELFREGLAEVVKMAAVLDAAAFERLERLASRLVAREPAALDEALEMAVDLKMSVVVADPFERDRRRWLNHGHTIGHALESAAGLALRHGQAVALGMVAECRAADSPVVERVAALLAALGLPTEVPASLRDVSRLWPLVLSDKKASAGRVPMIVPVELGRGVVVELTPERLARALP
jgi:3-dehydroquinate synthetase